MTNDPVCHMFVCYYHYTFIFHLYFTR